MDEKRKEFIHNLCEADDAKWHDLNQKLTDDERNGVFAKPWPAEKYYADQEKKKQEILAQMKANGNDPEANNDKSGQELE